MRLLKQPEELLKSRFTRLGIDLRYAYFQCVQASGLGIWRVDTFIPSSHTRVLSIPFEEMHYAHSTMGRDERGRVLIYILLISSEQNLLSVRLHEIRIEFNNKDPTHNTFELGHPPDFSNPFFSIPLHNAALGFGQREREPGSPRVLFVYDGSIVQGDIPYWRMLLDRDSWSFSVEEDTVPAVDPVRVGGLVPENEPRMVSRFPVVLDGAKRRFLRFGLDQRLFVFTEERIDGEPTSHGNWIPYDMRGDSRLNLLQICGSRGLRETYSSNGHRATAIESRFTFIVDDDVCILRHRLDDRHQHYWRLILDDSHREYYFEPCGVAEVGAELSVGRMSYTAVNERIAVIAGMEELAVIDLQPQRLAEIAFWAIQKQVSSQCPKSGAFFNGWSMEKISKIIGYIGPQELI